MTSTGSCPGSEIIISWRTPEIGALLTRVAEQGDLLAIKLVAEEIDPCDAAREAGVAVGVIDAVLRDAVWKGLIVSPPSRLRREGAIADSAPAPGIHYGRGVYPAVAPDPGMRPALPALL